MAHPSTLWATAAEAGTFAGTSLANAAKIDPGGGNDIMTVVNSDVPAAYGTVIKLCADIPVLMTATWAIARDGAYNQPFTVVGRSSGDTYDSQVILNANNGAFSVWTHTTADYWQWKNITSYNTDELAGHHGWDVGANSVNCQWIGCKAKDVYYGWNWVSGCTNYALYGCWADNCYYGFYSDSENRYVRAIRCLATGSTVDGFRRMRHLSGCIAADNGGAGIYRGTEIVGCTAHGNTSHGIIGGELNPKLIVDCIVVNNGGYGVYVVSALQTIRNLAHYNNTSGAIYAANAAQYEETGTVVLTGDPFVDAAAGDFALNGLPGRGLECRNGLYTFPDGLTICRGDLGASQHAVPPPGLFAGAF